MDKVNLTANRLREALNYTPETGGFTWRITSSNRSPVGSVAGRDNGNGYRRIMVDGVVYYAHRLAWLYVYGEWPLHEIDHCDGNRSNNRIVNLRPATHKENGQNQALRSTNSSGHHGVSWSKQHGQWCAYICVGGKKKHLGLFDDVKNAGAAYLVAKQKIHQFQPVPRDIVNA